MSPRSREIAQPLTGGQPAAPRRYAETNSKLAKLSAETLGQVWQDRAEMNEREN